MPTTYKDKTYEAVLRWKAETRIAYCPNPKRGKSKLRYAMYMKARTVAEAMKLGSLPGDLFFDYEHNHITVLGGPLRRAPLNPDEEKETWTDTDRMLAKMHRAWQTWSKTFSIAAQLGVDRRQITSDKYGAETAAMRAGRLAANEMAKMVLRECDETRRKVADRDVLAALLLWGFKDTTTRRNVMPSGVKSVHSDTLGLVGTYDGEALVTAATTQYREFTQLLCRWLKDHMPKELGKPAFGWTSINVNGNYAGKLHRDAGNEGPSLIKAFGEFTGGRLHYWADDQKAEGTVEKVCKKGEDTTLDIRTSLALFDGNRGHAVEAFTGERFSLVFFCAGYYHKMDAKIKRELARCGFDVPRRQGMELARKMVGAPRGYLALAKRKMTTAPKPVARAWPQRAAAQGTNFCAASMQDKAKVAIRQLGSSSESRDTEFVGYRISYQSLPDGRRRCIAYLRGASGGERTAAVGDEEQQGSGRYLYKKAQGFPFGSALETPRIGEVRAWCDGLVSQPMDPGQGKRCLRSLTQQHSIKRWGAAAADEPPAKRARRSS